jgi:hypothetical protein
MKNLWQALARFNTEHESSKVRIFLVFIGNKRGILSYQIIRFRISQASVLTSTMIPIGCCGSSEARPDVEGQAGITPRSVPRHLPWKWASNLEQEIWKQHSIWD